MRRKVIDDAEWDKSFYRTASWEQSVDIVRWEHDYIRHIHIIDYNEPHNACKHTGAWLTINRTFFCPICGKIFK